MAVCPEFKMYSINPPVSTCRGVGFVDRHFKWCAIRSYKQTESFNSGLLFFSFKFVEIDNGHRIVKYASLLLAEIEAQVNIKGTRSKKFCNS